MMRIPWGGGGVYCFEYVMCDLSSPSTNNLKGWVLSKGHQGEKKNDNNKRGRVRANRKRVSRKSKKYKN